MKFLRTVSTRRLLALIAGVIVAARRRHRDRRCGRPASAPCRRASRSRSRGPPGAAAPSGHGDQRSDQLHQQPDRLDRPPGRGPDPQRASGRLWLRAPGHRSGSSCSPTTATPRSSSTTAASGSTTRPRTPRTRARCRPTRSAQPSASDQAPAPVDRADPDRHQPPRAARRPLGRDPERRRRPGRVHASGLAQARRRPARRRRSSPGTPPAGFRCGSRSTPAASTRR